jgi:hypothetical protein
MESDKKVRTVLLMEQIEGGGNKDKEREREREKTTTRKSIKITETSRITGENTPKDREEDGEGSTISQSVGSAVGTQSKRKQKNDGSELT